MSENKLLCEKCGKEMEYDEGVYDGEYTCYECLEDKK